MGKVAYLHASTSVAVSATRKIDRIGIHGVGEKTEQTLLDSGQNGDVSIEQDEALDQSSVSDASLYRNFHHNGDAVAFETLFNRHRKVVVAYIWALSGSRAIADDISQHCWLRVIELDVRKGYQQTPGATFKSYLMTMARNRYIDEYKRKHVETRSDAIDEQTRLVASEGTACEIAAVHEQSEAIDAAIATLPIEQRDVLALWLQGFSIQEMVNKTGAPRDTVLSRKKYALKKLQRLLAALDTRSCHV